MHGNLVSGDMVEQGTARTCCASCKATFGYWKDIDVDDQNSGEPLRQGSKTRNSRASNSDATELYKTRAYIQFITSRSSTPDADYPLIQYCKIKRCNPEDDCRVWQWQKLMVDNFFLEIRPLDLRQF